jgi:hypothetical protein
VFCIDYDKIAHGARVQAYLKAIETVAQGYPQDDEAQLFYGITLNVAASPNDKTYANQLKGAATGRDLPEDVVRFFQVNDMPYRTLHDEAFSSREAKFRRSEVRPLPT